MKNPQKTAVYGEGIAPNWHKPQGHCASPVSAKRRPVWQRTYHKRHEKKFWQYVWFSMT